MNFILADAITGTYLNSIITSAMVQGVLNEILNLLPILLPVVITFIAIRKGIAFVMGMLRSA